MSKKKGTKQKPTPRLGMDADDLARSFTLSARYLLAMAHKLRKQEPGSPSWGAPTDTP